MERLVIIIIINSLVWSVICPWRSCLRPCVSSLRKQTTPRIRHTDMHAVLAVCRSTDTRSGWKWHWKFAQTRFTHGMATFVTITVTFVTVRGIDGWLHCNRAIDCCSVHDARSVLPVENSVENICVNCLHNFGFPAVADQLYLNSVAEIKSNIVCKQQWVHQ